MIPRGLYLLKEVCQSEGQLYDEGGGVVPGEVLEDALQSAEGLHHQVTAGGVAAAQHEGLQDAKMLYLQRNSHSEIQLGNTPCNADPRADQEAPLNSPPYCFPYS